MKAKLILLTLPLLICGCSSNDSGSSNDSVRYDNEFVNNVTYIPYKSEGSGSGYGFLSNISFFSDGRGNATYYLRDNDYCSWDFMYLLKDNTVIFPKYNGTTQTIEFYMESNQKQFKITYGDRESKVTRYYVDFIDYVNRSY